MRPFTGLVGLAAGLLVAAAAAAQPAVSPPPSPARPDAAHPPPAHLPATFRDCRDCPAMVAVPAGSFVMGAADDDGSATGDARPQRTVRIAAFAMGRTAVTRGEFARFVAATRHRPETVEGCWYLPFPHNFERHGPMAAARWRTWRNPGFPQTDAHPVVCVTHADALAYTAWLAARTGKPYRLPSEAEWEYAARAGTTGRRWWGDRPVCAYENIADLSWADAHGFRERDPEYVALCRDGHPFTAPAGRLRANPFGLHDMMGNVAQWLADCAHDSYVGAPADGRAWMAGGPVELSGGCRNREVRGHMWAAEPYAVNVTGRGGANPDRQSYGVGFRVARDLP